MNDGLDQGAAALGGVPLWAALPLLAAGRHSGINLNPVELTRAQGYLPGRPREDFVAGRILVRVLAAALLNRLPGCEREVDPGELLLSQYCQRCASTGHGPAQIRASAGAAATAVSYARAGGWLLIALAPEAGVLGVDLADPRDGAFTPETNGIQLESYAYSHHEREHLEGLSGPARVAQRARWWTVKEAVAKASGEGLAGVDGIPVVAGPGTHELLLAGHVRIMELGAGSSDDLGTVLPAPLVGTVLWAGSSSAN